MCVCVCYVERYGRCPSICDDGSSQVVDCLQFLCVVFYHNPPKVVLKTLCRLKIKGRGHDEVDTRSMSHEMRKFPPLLNSFVFLFLFKSFKRNRATDRTRGQWPYSFSPSGFYLWSRPLFPNRFFPFAGFRTQRWPAFPPSFVQPQRFVPYQPEAWPLNERERKKKYPE